MDVTQLRGVAKNVRKSIVSMLAEAGSGHAGGAMGIADVVTALYFSELNIDPNNPQLANRDRFVLSAAHMVPVLYATLAERGFFSKDKLAGLRKFRSGIEGHTVRNLNLGVETTGGSLGQGTSIAVGFALAARMDKADWRTYCVIGDGESNEGSVWEAAMLAAKEKLDNLVFILDRNNIQLSGDSTSIMPIDPIDAKWQAFNWHTIEIDGNDTEQILKAFVECRTTKGKPSIIIANTVPGKGVDYMENKWQWHGKVPNKEELQIALAQIDAMPE